MTLQRLGRQQEAIPWFEQALEREPHNANALTNLGLALTLPLRFQALEEATHAADPSALLRSEAVALAVSALACFGVVHLRTFFRRSKENERFRLLAEEQARTQAALLHSEQLFQNLVEGSNDGFLAMDAQERILFANTRVAELLGTRPAELVGRSFHEFMAPESVERVERAGQRRPPWPPQTSAVRHAE